MASGFTISPRSSLSKTNDYTSKIHKIFTQHWNTLKSERQATIDRIDTWHDDSIERIKKYADKQKTLINDHYNRLRVSFDENYEDNLDTANEYFNAKQADPFNELYKECQSLKFQIATLNFVKYEFDQPEITAPKEQIETKALETRNSARRRRRCHNRNNNETDNSSAASAALPSDSVASNSKQIDDRPLSETKPKKKINPTRSTTNDSNNQSTKIVESNNKCPVCFMIFPLHMSAKDRQQHANEHYIDD